MRICVALQFNIFCDGKTISTADDASGIDNLAKNIIRLCDVRYLQDNNTPLPLPEEQEDQGTHTPHVSPAIVACMHTMLLLTICGFVQVPLPHLLRRRR